MQPFLGYHVQAFQLRIHKLFALDCNLNKYSVFGYYIDHGFDQEKHHGETTIRR